MDKKVAKIMSTCSKYGNINLSVHSVPLIPVWTLLRGEVEIKKIKKSELRITVDFN